MTERDTSSMQYVPEDLSGKTSGPRYDPLDSASAPRFSGQYVWLHRCEGGVFDAK